MIEDLVRKNRSCRRFFQKRRVDSDTLKGLVNLGRLSASAGNLQPLAYVVSCQEKTNARIFACLTWAAYLKDWSGPKPGEQPSAYIVVLGNTAIARDFGCDHGIAAQSILLGARDCGLAGCMLAAIDRGKLRRELSIPENYKILLVIALGAPKEDVTIEPVGTDGSIRYWRDGKGIHHVPKRELADIIIGSYA